MLDKIIKWTGQFIVRRWKTILVSSLILIILSGYLAGLLFQEIKFSWKDIVPKGSRTIKEYMGILKDFKSANAIIITVKAGNRLSVEKAVKFAGMELKKEKKFFRNVMYKNETRFMKKYRMLLTKSKDLRNIKKNMSDFNIVPFIRGVNNNLEEEYVGNSGNMKKKEKEASMFMASLYDFFTVLDNYSKGIKDRKNLTYLIKQLTIGQEFFLSPDRKMALITVYPNVSMDDIDGTVKMVNHIDKLFFKWKKFMPGVEFGQTGMHTITRDEMKTVSEDSGIVTFIAFILIILLLIYAFKMKSAPVLGMLTLLAGILTALGLTYVFIGSLNLMTAMVAAILMGLGIDYSVHILAQYTEKRSLGASPEDSVIGAINNCGRGLFIGAVTTAAAFLILVFIPFDAMAELGAVIALGVLSCMTASFLLLPALLLFKENVLTRKKKKSLNKSDSVSRRMKYHFIADTEKKVNRFPILTLGIVLIFTSFFLVKALDMEFSGDLKEIEAKGLKSIELGDEILKRFDMTADSVMVTSDSLKEDRSYYKMLDSNPMVSFVESISSYLPTKDQQNKRLKIIKELKKVITSFKTLDSINRSMLIKEINRFRMNMLEMRDLAYTSGLTRLYKRCSKFIGEFGKAKGKNNYLKNLMSNLGKRRPGRLLELQKTFSIDMKKNMRQMMEPDRLTINKLPVAVKKRLISDDGKRYLISAYLMKNNWENISENVFLNNLGKTTKGRATGTILFMKVLVDTSIREGRKAVILALIAIFILIMLDFKNLRAGVFSFLNLAVSAVWMVGIMALIGEKLNFMNVLAFPIIIGIGIDDSVHIMHRYKRLGIDGLTEVLSSTGRAVFLTSVTTMFGFGSLYFAKYEGLRSFGVFLFVGVAIAFFMSVIFLPALMRVFPDIFNKKQINKGGDGQ